jgi:hypothetical protein
LIRMALPRINAVQRKEIVPAGVAKNERNNNAQQRLQCLADYIDRHMGREIPYLGTIRLNWRRLARQAPNFK